MNKDKLYSAIGEDESPLYNFKITYNDRFISISEGWCATPWDHAQKFATKIFDTREKAVRDALIAMGWTPPIDDDTNAV